MNAAQNKLNNFTDSLPSTATDDNRVDLALLAGIQEGNMSTMKSFYERYKKRVIPFLHRLTSDHLIIEEAYNDLMLQVWQNAHQFKGQAKVSSWVFTIAYRSCLKIIRKETRHTVNHNDHEPEPTVQEHNDDHLLQDAIVRLSAKHRMVIELCYFEGYTIEEISDIAKCPVNTVKTRLHHARKQLAKSLKQLESWD